MVNSLTHLKKKKQVQGDDLGITSDDKGKKSKGKRREILNLCFYVPTQQDPYNINLVLAQPTLESLILYM
jgi:hypothetical protein